MAGEVKLFLIRFAVALLCSGLFGIAMTIVVPRIIIAIKKNLKYKMWLYFALIGLIFYVWFRGPI